MGPRLLYWSNLCGRAGTALKSQLKTGKFLQDRIEKTKRRRRKREIENPEFPLGVRYVDGN